MYTEREIMNIQAHDVSGADVIIAMRLANIQELLERLIEATRS